MDMTGNRNTANIADDRSIGESESIARRNSITADKCKSSDNGDGRLVVDKPHAHDILFARGNNNANRHIGNVFLRQLAMQRKHHQKEGSHPSQRLIVAYEIFGEIKKLDPPGRFLMQTPYDCSKWYDVSDSNAVREICNLLRELNNEELALSTNNEPSPAPKPVTQKESSDEEASIHSQSTHSTHNTANSNISRLLSSAAMIDQSQIKLLTDFKNKKTQLNNINNGTDRSQEINRSAEDKATLELIQRYQSLQNSKNLMEANGIKSSSIDKNLSQLSHLGKCEESYMVDNRQLMSSQLSMTNLSASNVHLINRMLENSGKVDYGQTQAKPEEKLQLSSSSQPEQKKREVEKKKEKISTKRQKVSLPKIDNDELSQHSKHSVFSTQHSVYSGYSMHSRRSQAQAQQVPKPRPEVKKTTYEDSSKSSSKSKEKRKQKSSDSSKSVKKESDHHHQQVIMPLSYIGHSFMNSPDCSEESKSVFEEIAMLGQRTNENALLYLPSIIGSLCKRVMELEENKNDN